MLSVECFFRRHGLGRPGLLKKHAFRYQEHLLDALGQGLKAWIRCGNRVHIYSINSTLSYIDTSDPQKVKRFFKLSNDTWKLSVECWMFRFRGVNARIPSGKQILGYWSLSFEPSVATSVTNRISNTNTTKPQRPLAWGSELCANMS